nr:hypothetical protein Iba_chr13cCG4940 [Ipomoea batatas]
MLKGNIGCEVILMYFSKVIQGWPSQNFSSMLRKQGSELFIPLEKEHLQWGLQKQCTRTQSLVSGHLKGGGAQPWSSRAYVYQKLGSSLSSGMWVLFLVYKSYPSKEKRDMKYISTISSINLTQLKILCISVVCIIPTCFKKHGG